LAAPAGARPLPVWGKLLLSVAVLVATAAGVEVVLRTAGVGVGERSFEFAGDADAMATSGGQFSTHPKRSFTLRAPFELNPQHAGMYALDRWPFRGVAALPAPADFARIAVVGDSCVFGVGVHSAQTLASRIQIELEEQGGWTPLDVLVCGFGVPGYSTVQIRAVLEDEVLARFDPAAVVLYLAAWNDHGPALGPNDVELRAARARSAVGRLVRRTAWHALLRREVEAPPLERDRILESWTHNTPLLGRRVPEADLEREVAAILDRAREGGRPVVVVLPAHRTPTRDQHPGLARDRETVRRLAEARGIACVDSEALFSSADTPRDAHFFDGVHPAPAGFELQAKSVATVLLERATARFAPARPGGLSLAIEGGARHSALGDVRVRVRVGGWRQGSLPALFAGGGPLLDIRAVGPALFEGTLPRNAPGAHGLVLCSDQGIAYLPGALVLDPPEFRLQREHTAEDAPLAFVLRSRPGDRARARGSLALLAAPEWDVPGSARWLAADGAFALPGVWFAGADGSARVEVPEDVAARFPERFWVQALVTPRGCEAEPIANVWTAPFEVRRGEFVDPSDGEDG